MARGAGVLILVGTLLLTSCTSAPSKYGGPMAPVELRAAAGSALDSPGGDIVARWVDEASDGTDGAMTLVVRQEQDEPGADADGAVLQRLRDGELDLGVIRAPAFASAGVTTFQALQAPFLVDNDEAATLVSTDPIAQEMLDDLDEVGLVGLALVPGGLRHPVGWDQPLLSLEDYRGAVINTRASPDVDRLFAALGATTDHTIGQERIEEVASGALRGLEMSLLIHPNAGAPAVLTGNVVLYTKFDVVAVRRETFDSLSDPQRDALQAALERAVADALASRPAEPAAAQQWCELPGQAIVAASQEQVAGLHRATASLVAELRQDAFTARVIDRIASLTGPTSVTELPACAGPPAPDFVMSARGDQHVLDGTWRFETTRQDLLDVGVPPGEVDKDVGVHTYVFDNGRMTGGKEGEYCFGSYALDGQRFAWTFPPTSCGGSFQATYTVEGDRLLLEIDPLVLDGWFFRGYMKHGFVRIADAP